MRIIISPFSSKLFNNNPNPNPKNYPYWKELIEILEENHQLVQVGVKGEPELVKTTLFNMPSVNLAPVLKGVDIFISVDNFFPHFAHHYNKSGIVIFNQSDPKIFGYKENVNLLKDTKYLRQNQFERWDMTPYIKEAFVTPLRVIQAVNEIDDRIRHQLISTRP